MFILRDSYVFDVGQNVSLICKIPRITVPITAEWRKKTDKKIILQQDFLGEKDTESSSHKRFYLNLEAVSTHNSGWYTCEANSSIGSDKDSIFLNVTSK